jgi:hypothetical protein
MAVTVVGAGVAGCGDGDGDGDPGDERRGRQDEVAERGAEVMPFDLDGTTHAFTPQDDGLVQTVVVDDTVTGADRREQLELVRRHLRLEADRFAAGDYGDPAAIHGDAMPGLAELEAGADGVDVAYDATEAGGRITFLAADAELVDALHRWAEAQVADHGAHAEP